MKKTKIYILLLTLFPSSLLGIERFGKDQILGRQVKALVIAVEEFEKQPLDLEKYEIRIIEARDEIHFLFGDPDCKHAHFGSCSNLLSFEVSIDKNTLKVIDSHYSR